MVDLSGNFSVNPAHVSAVYPHPSGSYQLLLVSGDRWTISAADAELLRSASSPTTSDSTGGDLAALKVSLANLTARIEAQSELIAAL